MNPKQGIFTNGHNIPTLSREALAAQELSQIGTELFNVGATTAQDSYASDSTEVGYLIDLVASPRDLARFTVQSEDTENESAKNYSVIQIFEPYESALVDELGAAQLQTSIVRVKLGGPAQEYTEAENELLFFVLSPDGNSVKPDSLKVGKNLGYAALLRDKGKEVEFLRYTANNGEKMLYSEFANDDVIDQTVPTQRSFTMQYGDPSIEVSPVEIYSEEYFELLDEMRKALDAYRTTEPDALETTAS